MAVCKMTIRGCNSHKWISNNHSGCNCPGHDIDDIFHIEVSWRFPCYLYRVPLDKEGTSVGFLAAEGDIPKNPTNLTKGRWLCAEVTQVSNPKNETGSIQETGQKISHLSNEIAMAIYNLTANDVQICHDTTKLIVPYLHGQGSVDVYLTPVGSLPTNQCKFTVEEIGNFRFGIKTFDGMYLRSPSWSNRLMLNAHCGGADEHFKFIEDVN